MGIIISCFYILDADLDDIKLKNNKLNIDSTNLSKSG
ncbi:hypothetical protein S100892_00681 [Pediococcus pentosaceus]|uniref:Uncharacterized protein n=1 Tax=Pediococcus pentosaceus TaxID=1255 RepID=A0A1Y0VM59_PEDPE|nr:hypothetical protein S100892_00681 [Pediococcus pentosaceus]